MARLQGPTLTERDLTVLLNVYKYRYLSVSQIARLHFPSMQTAYRRLRAMTALKLLAAFTTPTMTEHLYFLGRRGADAVAGALGVPLEELRWAEISRPPKDYYFLCHFLEVNDFRITLTKTCESAGLQLLGFIPEYLGVASSGGGMAKHIKSFVCDLQQPAGMMNHTPDAVFAISKDATPALFFLELDRGTEVVGKAERGVLKACRFYLNYLLGSDYQRYCQDFGCEAFRGFRALIVTTSEARVRNIQEAVSALPFVDKAKRFIWLAIKRDVADTVFEPIWRSADVNDATRYRIA